MTRTAEHDRAQRSIGWRAIGYFAAGWMLLVAAGWAVGAHSAWGQLIAVVALAPLILAARPAGEYMAWYVREGRRRCDR